jgi:CheY-like chemotaxis protein
LIRYVLEKYGAEVEVVDNGEIAVERALESRDEGSSFDLILMDIEMPVMDGYEATRSLRQRDFDLPILALTAHATAADRKQCLAAGCSDFIEKPIDRLQLIETIRLHLQKPSGTPIQV